MPLTNQNGYCIWQVPVKRKQASHFYLVTFKEHPFNLKGGGVGAMVFGGKTFSVGKFDWKKILSMKWAEKIFCWHFVP